MESTGRAIEAVGGTATRHQADVRTPHEIYRVAEEIVAYYGEVSILVNAAGMPLTKCAFDVSEDDWVVVMDTDLKGVFFASVAFGKHMAQKGYGKIVNLSSTYAESVGIGKAVYAIAKAGVSHMTRALALEWAPLGVRVNALAPTATVTPTRFQVFADKERSAWLLGRIPMGRFGQTQDLVGAALFLASEASDFVTGHTLYVDGGWHGGR